MRSSQALTKSQIWRRALYCTLLGAFVVYCLITVWLLRQPKASRPLVAQMPPDFPAEGVWIRPALAPNLAGLHGRVVFLQFGFLG